MSSVLVTLSIPRIYEVQLRKVVNVCTERQEVGVSPVRWVVATSEVGVKGTG